MDELGFLFSPFGVAIVAIAGGIFAGIVSTMFKARIRELEIRERIAMIEHGLVPPPERDPEGFEQQMRVVDQWQQRPAAPRFRSGGIMVMYSWCSRQHLDRSRQTSTDRTVMGAGQHELL